MTEYNYSPEAYAAYNAKLQRIDRWRNELTKHAPVNPFQTATTVRDSDFYEPKKHKNKVRSPRRHNSGKYSSDESSDDGGPDRPPTPPASAPVIGAQYSLQYPTYPTYPPPYQTPAVPVASPSSSVLVPVWTGAGWVYQPAASAPVPQASPTPVPIPQTTPLASAPVGGSYFDSHHRKSRKRDRDRTSIRKQSHSVPPLSPGYTVYPGATSPGYAFPYTYSPAGSQYTALTAPVGSPGGPAVMRGGYAFYLMNQQPSQPVSAGVYPTAAVVPPTSTSAQSGFSYPGPPVVIMSGKKDKGKSSGFFGRLKGR